MSQAPKTLFQKVWESHVVAAPEGEPALLYIDLHLIHEVTSPQAFEGLRLAGRKLRRPDRVQSGWGSAFRTNLDRHLYNMRSVKMEAANHQVIEMTMFISNLMRKSQDIRPVEARAQGNFTR